MESAASRGFVARRLEKSLFCAVEGVFEQINEWDLFRVMIRINGFEIGKYIGDLNLNRLEVSFLGA